MTALDQTGPGLQGENTQSDITTFESLVNLVKTSQEGNLDAFGILVDRFQKMALALAYYRLGDFHLAQDVAQEAFIEAYINLTKLVEPAAFPSWFRKIVLKRIDRVTRDKPAPPLLDLEQAETIISLTGDPLQQAETKEIRTELHELIDRLPLPERTVITLFYLNDYSQNEIAHLLQVPLSTVKKRLYSGRQHLKDKLDSQKDLPIRKQKIKKEKDNLLPEKVQFLLAVRAGNLNKVEALLNKDPFLALATEEWDDEISRQFYVAMAHGQSALWRPTHNGHLEMVELLLAKGSGLNQSLPLEEAVLMGHVKIARVFIGAGGNVNIRLGKGLSLLTIAVIRENEAMVELLLAQGAELLNSQVSPVRTPLHWAILKGNPSLTGLLLAAGADPFARDETGQTPLELAQKLQNQSVLQTFKPFIMSNRNSKDGNLI